MERLKLIEKIVDEYFNGKQDYYKVETFKTEKNGSESYNIKVIENYSNKIHVSNVWMQYEPYTNRYRIVIKITKNGKLFLEEYNVPAETNSDQKIILKRMANFIFNDRLMFSNKESAYNMAESFTNNREHFKSFNDIRKEFGYDKNQNKLNISLILKRNEKMEQIFIEVIAEYDQKVHLKITSKDNMCEKNYQEIEKERLFTDIMEHINTIL